MTAANETHNSWKRLLAQEVCLKLEPTTKKTAYNHQFLCCDTPVRKNKIKQNKPLLLALGMLCMAVSMICFNSLSTDIQESSNKHSE